MTWMTELSQFVSCGKKIFEDAFGSRSHRLIGISPIITFISNENGINRIVGHLCAHIGQTGPGELPEDGEMKEMTLTSRRRIRNSSTGRPSPSTLPTILNQYE